MRKLHILIVLIVMNVITLASVWISYLNHRKGLGLADTKHIPEILAQLAVPTVLIITAVSFVVLVLLYLGAFCLWKLRAADRKQRLLVSASTLTVLAAISISYASMYHKVDIGALALVCFLILFGGAIAVLRYLPQMIARERDTFHFLR